MRRILLPEYSRFINKITHKINIFKLLNNMNTYQTEFIPSYELTWNRNTELKKLRGIRFHAYKNYGLLRKNKINTHNEEFQTFLFGDKIKSQ